MNTAAAPPVPAPTPGEPAVPPVPAPAPGEAAVPPVAVPTPGEAAARSRIARDLAAKCVALAVGSGDARTYSTLMELSAVYTRCADLLAAEGAAGEGPASIG